MSSLDVVGLVSLQAKLKPVYSLYKHLKQTLTGLTGGTVANTDLMRTAGLDLDMTASTATTFVGSPRAVVLAAETQPAEVLVVAPAAPPGPHPALSASFDVGMANGRDAVLVLAAAAATAAATTDMPGIGADSNQAPATATPSHRRLLGPSNGRPRPGHEHASKAPGNAGVAAPHAKMPVQDPSANVQVCSSLARSSFGSSGLTTTRVQLETGGAKPQQQLGDGAVAGDAHET